MSFFKELKGVLGITDPKQQVVPRVDYQESAVPAALGANINLLISHYNTQPAYKIVLSSKAGFAELFAWKLKIKESTENIRVLLSDHPFNEQLGADPCLAEKIFLASNKFSPQLLQFSTASNKFEINTGNVNAVNLIKGFHLFPEYGNTPRAVAEYFWGLTHDLQSPPVPIVARVNIEETGSDNPQQELVKVDEVPKIQNSNEVQVSEVKTELESLGNLLDIYFKRGDVEMARKFAEMILSLDREQAKPYLYLAHIYFSEGKFLQAKQNYQIALKKGAQDSQMFKNLVHIEEMFESVREKGLGVGTSHQDELDRLRKEIDELKLKLSKEGQQGGLKLEQIKKLVTSTVLGQIISDYESFGKDPTSFLKISIDFLIGRVVEELPEEHKTNEGLIEELVIEVQDSINRIFGLTQEKDNLTKEQKSAVADEIFTKLTKLSNEGGLLNMKDAGDFFARVVEVSFLTIKEKYKKVTNETFVEIILMVIDLTINQTGKVLLVTNRAGTGVKEEIYNAVSKVVKENMGGANVTNIINNKYLFRNLLGDFNLIKLDKIFGVDMDSKWISETIKYVGDTIRDYIIDQTISRKIKIFVGYLKRKLLGS